MINIVRNKNNLTDASINETVTRVKAMIINSDKQILLGYSHCEYQFPGGHVREYESLRVALTRELKEETGLDYDLTNFEPIACLTTYLKDYPEVGKNRKNVIYYYEVKDDRKPDLSNTHYTSEELDGNYKLRYIPLDIVCDVIEENALTCGDVAGITSEMLEVFKYYFSDLNKNNSF